MWSHIGQNRPPFAEEPGPGQESVWDYPRPPRIEHLKGEILVKTGERVIARSQEFYRVLETASPPSIYLQRSCVDTSMLEMTRETTNCEWKGRASYLALLGQQDAPPVAWFYQNAKSLYVALEGCLSFYPGRVNCWLNGEAVRAQAGGFYGGWITNAITGPFKGDAGTQSW